MAINRDDLMSAPSKPIAAGAMTLADKLQGFPPAYQPLIVAALFSLMCEASGLRGADVLTAADNLTATSLYKPNVTFQGLRLYIANELLRS